MKIWLKILFETKLKIIKFYLMTGFQLMNIHIKFSIDQSNFNRLNELEKK